VSVLKKILNQQTVRLELKKILYIHQ